MLCQTHRQKTELGLAEYTETDVKQVLNEISRNSGTRFFKTFKMKRGRRYRDFLDYHWDGIKGSSCTYCTNLTIPERRFVRSKLREFEKIRANYKAVYRPLKAAMESKLQFARFVPRPRRVRNEDYVQPYEGLVAGITADGILCGLYFVTGAFYYG
ncbi:hypothetical protein P3T76_007189 [Phytophthora citrophthora]|uniref:Uncharacterized protein n=1 Tax=Phytophthora citrophthora TaxID=4793 RepID=A0AAD9GN97_9STRA|nr:hypothetical protein P3T76_007189 [Phytophthora citrophthora]